MPQETSLNWSEYFPLLLVLILSGQEAWFVSPGNFVAAVILVALNDHTAAFVSTPKSGILNADMAIAMKAITAAKIFFILHKRTLI